MKSMMKWDDEIDDEMNRARFATSWQHLAQRFIRAGAHMDVTLVSMATKRHFILIVPRFLDLML